MRATPPEPAATEPESSAERPGRELPEHARARLDLVLRHECELAEAEARHQAAAATLRERLSASDKAFRDATVEIVSLTRMLVELQGRSDVLARELDAARDDAGARQDELRSAIAAGTQALADARSGLDAAEEELAILRVALQAGGADAAPDGDAPGDDVLVRRSALFDADWYCRRYPDVQGAGMDPVEHYLLHGAAEGRDPGPAFGTAGYLRAYPDVAASGINPLVHYLRNGLREGRAGRFPPTDRQDGP